MDQERADHLNSIVDRLVNLSTTERTTALTHLYNLRTAAVEDLSDLSDNREHWDIVLGSPTQPDNVRTLVRDLTQLADDELARVGMQVSERSSIAQERVLQTAADEEKAKLQAQLAANAKQSVVHMTKIQATRLTNIQSTRELHCSQTRPRYEA
jgi:hypothetical protein